MKIAHGGTPIFVSPRQVGGIEVIQGKSRVRLAAQEVRDLIAILTQLSTTRDALGAREVVMNEHEQQ